MTVETVARAPLERTRVKDAYLWPAVGIVLVVFVGSWLSDQFGSYYPILIAVWGPLLYYAFFRAPPHVSARVLLLLGLLLEPPDERSGNGYWVPPLLPASTIFFDGMKKWSGIPGLSFSLFTVICVVVLWRGYKRRSRLQVTPPRETTVAIRVWFVALAFFLVWGLVRGGAGQPAYWQIIQPLTMGLCAAAFLYSLRGPADLRALGTIVVIVALTKGLLVVWVYEVVCRPLNMKPFYATTHSDSVSFAMAIVIVAAVALEQRDRKSLVRMLLIVPFMIVAIVMNNRRLAFVGVGAGVVTAYAMMRPGPLKRKITRALIYSSPLVLAYLKLGGSSTNPLFAPAALIRSVLSQGDASSITRDIENFNLIITLKENRILGPGFGFEYNELIKADDISIGFSLYRYIPHNSVLWLWSAFGLIGFTILWMLYPLLAYYAARAYRVAKSPLERAGSLATLSCTMILLAQNWGDMGFHSYTALVMFGACYAMAVKLCVALEARAA